MIALTLLAIALVYFIVLLGVATSSSIKSMGLRFTLLALLLSPVGYKVFDMYYGKYKFDAMCKANAGVNIYVKGLLPTKRIRLAEGYEAGSAIRILRSYPNLNEIEAPDKEYDIYGAFSMYHRGSSGTIESTLMGSILKTNGLKSYNPVVSMADYEIYKESTYFKEKRVVEWRTYLLSRNGKLVADIVGYHYDWTGWFFSFLSSCGEFPSEKADSKLINLVVEVNR